MQDVHFFTAVEPASRSITLARFARTDDTVAVNLVRWRHGLLLDGVSETLAQGPVGTGLDAEGTLGGTPLSATRSGDGVWELRTETQTCPMRFVPDGPARTYPDLDEYLPKAGTGYIEQPCRLEDARGVHLGCGVHGHRLGSPAVTNSWQWLCASSDDGSVSLTVYRVHAKDTVVASGFIRRDGQFTDVTGLDVLDVTERSARFETAGVMRTPEGSLLVEVRSEGQALLASPFPGVRLTVAQHPVVVTVDGIAMYGFVEDTRDI